MTEKKLIRDELKKIPVKFLSDLYAKIEEIGKGAYGKVYLGYSLKNRKKIVAIKEIKNFAKFMENKDLEKALVYIHVLIAEYKILKILSEEGCRSDILCYEDFFMDPTNKYMYLITDYIQGLNLQEQIGNIFDTVPYEQALNIIYTIVIKILDALVFVHKHGFIHADIKPDNILVYIVGGQDYQPILIDFGLSCLNNVQCTTRGSPIYISPESFVSQKLSEKSDIWSLGITFYEILVGNPYPNVINLQQLYKTLLNQPKLTFNTSLPKLDRVLNAMLTFDINDRPTAKQLYALAISL